MAIVKTETTVGATGAIISAVTVGPRTIKSGRGLLDALQCMKALLELEILAAPLSEEQAEPWTAKDEREAVLRFLEGFREEARGNPVSTYLDEMMLSRMIHEIRKGNHV